MVAEVARRDGAYGDDLAHSPALYGCDRDSELGPARVVVPPPPPTPPPPVSRDAEIAPADPRVCLVGRVNCSVILVAEMTTGANILVSGYSQRTALKPVWLRLDAGAIVHLSGAHAVGATAGVILNDRARRPFLGVRYRYWLNDKTGADLAAGLIFPAGRQDGGPAALTAEAGLDFADLVALATEVNVYREPYGGGTRAQWTLNVRLGSIPAAILTSLAVLALYNMPGGG
jgi:hypothetical protein